MANRYPLIANSSANQIQELASSDNIDLTGNNIVGVVGVNASGIITATTFVGNITGVAATFTGEVTYEDVTNVDSVVLSQQEVMYLLLIRLFILETQILQ